MDYQFPPGVETVKITCNLLSYTGFPAHGRIEFVPSTRTIHLDEETIIFPQMFIGKLRYGNLPVDFEIPANSDGIPSFSSYRVTEYIQNMDPNTYTIQLLTVNGLIQDLSTLSPIIVDSSGNTQIAGPRGPIGETGIQGAIGEPGLDGYNGVDGIDGSDGVDGLIGSTGLTGLTGNTGNTGSQGIPGTIGLTGLTGIQGVQGNEGTDGSTGLTGNIGLTGPEGPIGLTGIQGPIGPDGIDGSIGIDGPIGLTGNTGLTGTPGIDGDDGAQGIQGEPGTPGTITTLPLSVANGGTGGTATATLNGVVLGNTTAYKVSSAPSANSYKVFASNAGNIPSFINLNMGHFFAIWAKDYVTAATTVNVVLSGYQTIDGIYAGGGNSRTLVKNQTNPAENGIYVQSAGAWTRGVDASIAAYISGAVVSVSGGSQIGSRWTNSIQGVGFTVGTDPIYWFKVMESADVLLHKTSLTPSSTADSTGVLGDVCYDVNYFYVKTSTGWKRTALSTF